MAKSINNIIKADEGGCSMWLQVMPSAEENEEIDVWLKLYRRLLDTCTYLNIFNVIMQKLLLFKHICSSLAIFDYVRWNYTSVEFAVRSPALKPHSRVNFRTANSVRLGSSENNKKRCHNIVAVPNYS
ncbi:hypothetical protein [Nostoc sp. CCY 9925]|uniref:hypothetical protein n=1 Tax=Nostoc sp. CCY 9925 TaxID=3103865 RepID=UPI0039C6572B